MAIDYNRPTIRNNVLDKDWVRDIFMVDKKEVDGLPLHLRTWSSADVKFQNTTIGGSMVINPLPQPCVFTDPPAEDHVMNGIQDEKMGPYFSETFDDNYRIVTFRFGTLGFTSLLGFLSDMYHPGAAAMVNKGRVHQILFSIGKFVGTALQIIAWPIAFAGFVYKGLQFALRKPTSKFAYVKPAMPMYWSAVQNILNHLMVNSNLIFPEDPTRTGEDADGVYAMDAAARQATINMFPDLFPPSTVLPNQSLRLDVFVVANKAQRLAHQLHDRINELSAVNGNPIKTKELLSRMYRQHHGRTGMTMATYVNKWTSEALKFYNAASSESTGVVGGDEGSTDTADKMNLKEIARTNGDGQPTAPDPTLWDFLLSEMRDGGAFVSFRVDDTGPVTDTFSNNYKPSALAEKLNSMSATGRDTYYNTAGGSLGDGLIVDTIEGAVSATKDLVQGLMTGVGLAGFLVAGGGGVVSMPKYWEGSEAQLAGMNYSFTLKARYANGRARLQDIMLPLSCALAGVLPLSTGKHTYSNSLYCEFYDRGRMQTRLGAISSMTITRGDGNVGFTPDAQMLSVNVSFTIQPLEETVAMPVSEAFNTSDTLYNLLAGALVNSGIGAAIGLKSISDQLLKGLFDDETPFMDYMATLSGLGVLEQHYLGHKLKRKLALNRVNMASAWSTARMGAFLADSLPGRIFASGARYRVGA